MNSRATKPSEKKSRRYRQRSPAGTEYSEVDRKRVTRESMAEVAEEIDMDAEDTSEDEIEEEIEVPDIEEPWFIFMRKRFDRLDVNTKKRDKRIKEHHRKLGQHEVRITATETTLKTVSQDITDLKNELADLKAENKSLKRRVITNVLCV
jgi:chromosome segregation ATPase